MARSILAWCSQLCGSRSVRSGWPWTFVAFLLAFLLAGCENAPTGVTPLAEFDSKRGLIEATRSTKLDVELTRLLEQAADGRGVGYFRLPSSNQLRHIAQDPKNRLTPRKVALGRLLFHETALAVDNVRREGRETYSCAACHHGSAGYGAAVPQAIGEGGTGFGLAGEERSVLPSYNSEGEWPDLQPIRSPSILNCAYQELMLWNGQFGGVGDNLGTEDRWTPGTPLALNALGFHGVETQALAGLQVHRMGSVSRSRVAELKQYARLFASAFPGEREPITRLNAALAIAAFERTVLATRAPWQQWLRGQHSALTASEKRGAVLFLGKAGCVVCHSGPALTSMSFHAMGMNDLDSSVDPGRVDLRSSGGSVPEDTRLGRGGFTEDRDDDFAFKTPQLYNLADRAFFGHGSSFGSVREVVEYLNAGVAQNGNVPASKLAAEFQPLGLTDTEISHLTAFLYSGLRDSDLMRFQPDALPSGNCTPVNDSQARIDLGCEDISSGVIVLAL